MKIKTQPPMGHCKSNAKGKVHSNTAYLKKQEKSQIYNLTLHLKQLEKEEMKNPRVSYVLDHLSMFLKNIWF